MLAVQPGGLDGADEELGAVGTRSGVSHGEDTRASVPQVEVLVLELLAVDALTTGALDYVSLLCSSEKYRGVAVRCRG